MKVDKFRRGQIWWYAPESGIVDSTYNNGKIRPVIIISNNYANAFSPVLLVVPCTTQLKKPLRTHLNFYIDDVRNTALAENIMSINTKKLDSYIGTMDDELLKQLEDVVRVSLGLEFENTVPSAKLADEEKVEELVKPVKINLDVESLNNSNGSIKKKRTRINLSPEEKIRFINDYKNHDINYMIKKYGFKDARAVQQKAYTVRKELGIKDDNRTKKGNK